jgi:tetratricopeptide (TPR) repeat protein
MAWGLAKIRRLVRSPIRILLVTAPGDASSGLDAAQCRALGALVQDHLELDGHFAMTAVTAVPEAFSIFQGQARTLVLQLEPKRTQDDLELSYRFVWGNQLRPSGPLPWSTHRASPCPPSQAFEGFLRTFPKAIPSPSRSLIPQDPSAFWDLVQISAWRLENQHLDQALHLAEALTAREPNCASVWILLGNLRYRQLLNRPVALRQEQADTEQALQRGLGLAPGHPRGTFLLSLLMTDSGNQREALEVLLAAREKQPHNPTLLTGITYAARGAGLLPLARRAMDMRDTLAFASLQPQAVELTCLYTGEIARFEASLQEQPGHLRSTSGVLPFYRGYLALLRGDYDRAHREFQAASELVHGYPNIRRLSGIYALILEGKKSEAWSQLRDYDQERIGMREPDGEFTLRLAEAYALMGDRASGMEMASRAFARGFSCSEWYERSPMLEPLRNLPKWQALMQHIREREGLMEDHFPVSRLDD